MNCRSILDDEDLFFSYPDQLCTGNDPSDLFLKLIVAVTNVSMVFRQWKNAVFNHRLHVMKKTGRSGDAQTAGGFGVVFTLEYCRNLWSPVRCRKHAGFQYKVQKLTKAKIKHSPVQRWSRSLVYFWICVIYNWCSEVLLREFTTCGKASFLYISIVWLNLTPAHQYLLSGAQSIA